MTIKNFIEFIEKLNAKGYELKYKLNNDDITLYELKTQYENKSVKYIKLSIIKIELKDTDVYYDFKDDIIIEGSPLDHLEIPYISMYDCIVFNIITK